MATKIDKNADDSSGEDLISEVRSLWAELIGLFNDRTDGLADKAAAKTREQPLQALGLAVLAGFLIAHFTRRL